MKESEIEHDNKMITVEDINEYNIIWFNSSNNLVNCGQVKKVYKDKREVLVFNYDAWSDQIIEFDKILRINTNYIK